MTRLIRLTAVTDKTGNTRSPIYAAIGEGLFPSPIKVGPRAAAWVESEIEQLIAARIRGESNASIKRLVQQMHEARRHATAEAA